MSGRLEPGMLEPRMLEHRADVDPGPAEIGQLIGIVP